MSTNLEMLAFAKKFLGQGGATFRKYCGLPAGAAYCNAYVTYVFQKSGNGSLFYDGKKVTYCPTSMSWCRKNLAQIPIYLAMEMDIIYFDWEPNGIPNHIGFVRGRKSDAEIYTIEGNRYDYVEYFTLTEDDYSIIGFGVMPENPDYDPENPGVENRNGEVELPPEPVEPEPPSWDSILDAAAGIKTVSIVPSIEESRVTY